MAQSWGNKISSIFNLLGQLEFTDGKGGPLDREAAFSKLNKLTLDIRSKHKTVYVIGNGASASMASHFAADMAKNGKLHTQVFSDLALITAISNDLGYKEVFAEPLRRRGRKGDMLVAISSSGMSENIIEAVKIANALEMDIVTLSAMKEDNLLRGLGRLNAYLPAKTYGDAETVHAAFLHFWIDLIVEN
ncbi:MAG: hypothetical protein A2020_07370 [Lentisphaerae bacterium GWF2_45_14]|nr:MAG: hypothetical protein A2020_07370 [Lentisphaerae bacterium GWF2_45_14]